MATEQHIDRALDMTFRDLQEAQKEWCAHNFPNSTPDDPFFGMVEEFGELAHATLKRKQGIRGSYAQHTEDMKDAVGDILVYMADFCTKHGLDMQECIETTWDIVRQRDWIKYPTNGLTK